MPDVEKIKKLRNLTGAGFKDCSAALLESNNSIDKAIEILRVKGISKATKKMSRTANEGVVAITDNKQKSSIIEINCETDFVAKNNDFINFAKELSDINNSVNSDREKLMLSKMENGTSVDENLLSLISKIGEKITFGRSKTIESKNTKVFKYHHTVVKDNLSKLGVLVSLESNNDSEEISMFGKQLSMHIAALNPLSIDIDGIDKEILKKEEQLISEELKSSGKTDDIIKKISIGKINKELGSLRTGRANANMLDLIKVDVYGQKMPINQLGTVTTPEPRMINIQVWDLNNVNLIDSSIKKSELGLNPQIDGQLIRLPIPDLSEERRNEMKKIVKTMGEKCKVSIRNIIREANDNLKDLLKKKEISEDEEKKNEKDIQNLTDTHIKLIDEKVSLKEKEIMTI